MFYQGFYLHWKSRIPEGRSQDHDRAYRWGNTSGWNELDNSDKFTQNGRNWALCYWGELGTYLDHIFLPSLGGTRQGEKRRTEPCVPPVNKGTSMHKINKWKIKLLYELINDKEKQMWSKSMSGVRVSQFMSLVGFFSHYYPCLLVMAFSYLFSSFLLQRKMFDFMIPRDLLISKLRCWVQQSYIHQILHQPVTWRCSVNVL